MTSNITTNDETVQNEGTSRRALLKGAVAAGVGAAVYASPVVSKVPAYATHGLSTINSTSSILCMGFSPKHANNTGDWHLSNNFPTDTTPPPTTTELPTPFQANAFLKANGFDNASWASGDHRNDGTPNQIGNSGFGLFHPNSPLTMINPDRTSTGVILRLRYWVGGAWREVHVTGHPNNMGLVTQDGNKDEPDGNQIDAAGWGGGGMGLKLLDPNCQIEMVNWHNGATTNASNLRPGTCNMSGSVIGAAARPLSSDNVAILGPDAPPNNVPNPWQGDPNRWRFFHSGAGSKKNNSGRLWVGGFTFRISCR